LLARAGDYDLDFPAILNVDENGGLVGEAIHSKRLIYASDVAADSNYFANDTRTRSEMIIPLLRGQEIIGALDLQSPQINAFSESHQRILSAYADRVAVALENQRLYEEVNRYTGELEWRVAKRTAELQHTKNRIEAILNSSSDIIITTSLDGTISNSNPTADTLLGYSAEEIFEHPLSMLFEPDETTKIDGAFQALIEELTSVRLELVAKRSNGTTFSVDGLFSPIKEAADKINGIVCSFRDISIRTSMEEELRKALASEQELNELKSSFVSMVSHEFRTPLSVILTSSDLVMSYGDRMSEDKKQGHLAKIRHQVHHLTRLLEDVLVLGKSDSVGMNFQPVRLNLKESLKNLIHDAQQTNDISHHIKSTLSDDLCANVLVDEQLLRHIIFNLLSNAMKYSPEDSSIFLELTCADQWATIRVRDEGIGIPAEYQARMYESFQRASNVGIVSGTGLGLAIVKRAVDAHQGTISFESKEGVGTTFTVKIPIATLSVD
jgi:PAS domain S-box-containing protein